MNAPLTIILAETKARLHALCGDRLQRIVLFGSRARGDAAPDSDIDLLLVFADLAAIGAFDEAIDRIMSELSLKHDAVLSASIATAEEIEHDDLPLFDNVRYEGVAV